MPCFYITQASSRVVALHNANGYIFLICDHFPHCFPYLCIFLLEIDVLRIFLLRFGKPFFLGRYSYGDLAAARRSQSCHIQPPICIYRCPRHQLVVHLLHAFLRAHTAPPALPVKYRSSKQQIPVLQTANTGPPNS